MKKFCWFGLHKYGPARGYTCDYEFWDHGYYLGMSKGVIRESVCQRCGKVKQEAVRPIPRPLQYQGEKR